MGGSASGDDDKPASPLGSVESQWGKVDAGHFGYESDEDRKSKRGLEDWELVEKIPESQRAVPYWFFAVVAVVLLVGIGLSFPFWGLRPGDHRPWLDWGYLVALVYIAVAGTFVWYMVRLYGSSRGGRLDSDAENEKPEDER
ncbi:MAG: hypothetical protein ABSH33_20145 [Steroidobacteraceae bacterium]|jgi:hypothetical protein